MKPIFARGNQRTLPRLKRLRQEAQTDKAARVVLRLDAIMLSLQNQTNGQIAQFLQADRSRVHAWITRWNDHGIEGLLEGHRSGRPSELTPNDVERINARGSGKFRANSRCNRVSQGNQGAPLVCGPPKGELE